jgi:RNA polymerase sigma factor (sigma-70 family)
MAIIHKKTKHFSAYLINLNFASTKSPFSIGYCVRKGKNPLSSSRKEVNSMEIPSFDKNTVEHQFDTLVKKVLAGEAKNQKAEIAKRAAHEANFSELSDKLVESFCSFDEHLSDYFSFEIFGFDVVIKNELLGEAVTNLPERKRIIILMSYFLDMSDYEIADELNLVRSTVTYHRESALAKLKRFMEEMIDDER